MFKIGEYVLCTDNTGLEECLDVDEKYVVDVVFDDEHLCVKGFHGMIHSDRFAKLKENV